MKKIVTIIVCLLGVVCAWASPFYRGAQAPVATMSSTSSMMRSSYRQNDMPTVNRVQGFRTSASYVTGGVTSEQTYSSFGRASAARRVGGHPEECPYCIDEDGDGNCDICGMDIYECDKNTCHCPVEFDWKALLFLTAAAGVYMAKKTKKSRA